MGPSATLTVTGDCGAPEALRWVAGAVILELRRQRQGAVCEKTWGGAPGQTGRKAYTGLQVGPTVSEGPRDGVTGGDVGGPWQFVQGLKARLRTVGFIPNAPGPEALKQGSDIPCLTFPAAPLLMDGGWIAGRPEGRLNKRGSGGEGPAGSRVREPWRGW